MAYFSEPLVVSYPKSIDTSVLSSIGPAPAIRISNISKSFPRPHDTPLTVLDRVGFDVEKDRVTAILGASGCGKSTLLNIIAGLAPADQGIIQLDGTPLQDFSDWRRIGYLFQDDRLLPWRTAQANVELGLEAEHVGTSERHERARLALNSVGLAGFEHAYPGELSGGMRSRVALARSLVKEPDILLLDEPFSKLDPTLRTQMHDELLRAQAQRHISVAFVTHDLEEAVYLADKAVIMHPGPGRVHAIIPIDLPRPRVASERNVSEQIRMLRTLV
ncbi:MAG: ABC transporter ATP-binding protein [Candidimonas sp.]|nr:MAG: ABC transporter ATP-binding protein [Candidimonas sp.]